PLRSRPDREARPQAHAGPPAPGVSRHRLPARACRLLRRLGRGTAGVMTAAREPSPTPTPTLVDTHAHLADPGLAADMTGVIDRAGQPRVVAIGETGLDRYRDRTPFAVQQEWFARHLALAHERDLPVVIHCRNSEADIREMLTRLGRPVRGVLHSFTGGPD